MRTITRTGTSAFRTVEPAPPPARIASTSACASPRDSCVKRRAPSAGKTCASRLDRYDATTAALYRSPLRFRIAPVSIPVISSSPASRTVTLRGRTRRPCSPACNASRRHAFAAASVGNERRAFEPRSPVGAYARNVGVHEHRPPDSDRHERAWRVSIPSLCRGIPQAYPMRDSRGTPVSPKSGLKRSPASSARD